MTRHPVRLFSFGVSLLHACRNLHRNRRVRPPLVLALVGTGGALRQQGGYGTREDQMGGIEGRFAHLVLEALEAPLTDPR